MPTLELNDEQVLDLVRQLPQRRQEELLRSLLSEQWGAWHQLSGEGQEAARKAAADRGLNWDGMTDEQRLEFIDKLVREDRACRG